jgi:IclR family acetate operon transcriptional repressor
MDPRSDSERKATRIQSVQRACGLLLSVAASPDGLTASEAAAQAGLALPTTHHLLNTLVAEGMLAKDSRRRFGPGPRLAVLAEAHLRADRVPEYLLEPLRALAQSTGETAYLAAWRGGEIRALATVEGISPVRVAAVQGSSYRNAHARAAGKLLLALTDGQRRIAYLAANPLERVTARTICTIERLEVEFQRIRDDGYAIDTEEFIDGVSCVAAPILEDGVLVASLTLSAPADRFARNRETLVGAVRDVAASVGKRARHPSDSLQSSEAV